MSALLLEGARNPGAPDAVDVVIADGVVAEVVPHGASTVRGSDAERVDVDGRWIVPGLHDRHVHLSQWAMVSRRLDHAGAASAAQTAALVRAAVDSGEPEVIGFGYRDGLWPDAASLALDPPEALQELVLGCGIPACRSGGHGVMLPIPPAGIVLPSTG